MSAVRTRHRPPQPQNVLLGWILPNSATSRCLTVFIKVDSQTVYSDFDDARGKGCDSEIAAEIERKIGCLSPSEKIGMRLRLAARLCENGAFGAADIWPADKVATAVVLAAQIERLVTRDSA